MYCPAPSGMNILPAGRFKWHDDCHLNRPCIFNRSGGSVRSEAHWMGMPIFWLFNMMKRKVVPGEGEEEIILFLLQEGFEKTWMAGKCSWMGEQGHSCHRGYCSIILKSTLKAH